MLIRILLLFCIIGLADKIVRRWNLYPYVDSGVAAAGVSIIPYVGISVMGPFLLRLLSPEDGTGGTYVLSTVLGTILSTDMGGYGVSLATAPDTAWGLYCGLVLGSCLGQFISFELPILNNATGGVGKENLFMGFGAGMIAAPVGLVVGGLVLRVSPMQLVLRIFPIIAACLLIAFGLQKKREFTEKWLETAGKLLNVLSIVFFGVVAVLVFLRPELVQSYLNDCMAAYLRLIVVVIGGSVLAGLVTVHFQLSFLKRLLKTNTFAITGLVLSLISSMAMVPVWKHMDERGQRMNAAFGVSGAFSLGGELAFAVGAGRSDALYAFLLSKLTAGVCAMVLVNLLSQGENVT